MCVQIYTAEEIRKEIRSILIPALKKNEYTGTYTIYIYDLVC